jgi:hypothetical protein
MNASCETSRASASLPKHRIREPVRTRLVAVNHDLEGIRVVLRDAPAQFLIGTLHLRQSAPEPPGSHGPGSIAAQRLTIPISLRPDIANSRPV